MDNCGKPTVSSKISARNCGMDNPSQDNTAPPALTKDNPIVDIGINVPPTPLQSVSCDNSRSTSNSTLDAKRKMASQYAQYSM